MRNLLKKRIILLLTIILGLGLSLSAIYFMYYRQDARRSSLSSGLITIDFEETSNVILSSNLPVVDAYGLEDTTPYSFTVKNTSKIPVDVEMKLDVKSNTTIPLGAIRYGVFINDKKVKKDYVHDDKILYTFEELLVDETIEVKIYFWVDYYYDVPNQIFNAGILVEGTSRDILWEPVTVTFDANGGTVDSTEKVVGIGSNYGRLPTPTKEGYTFAGWSGVSKNLLNIQTEESLPSNTTYSNTTPRIFTSNTYVVGLANNNYYNPNNVSNLSIESNRISFTTSSGYGVGFPLKLEKNKNYVLSYSCNETNEDDDRIRGAIMYYKEDGTLIKADEQPGQGYKQLTFTLPEDTDMVVVLFRASGSNNQVEFTNIQIEEGTEATEYEPYYVSNNTKVTINENHTLVANWIPGNYTVTFNGNGGNVSSNSKQVTYKSIYGELSETNRSGYSFLGWNGKNLLNIQTEESLPSNTTYSNTTPRIFTSNTYVVGLASNNYYNPNNISNLSIESNRISFTTSSGYGVGFPLELEKNKNYVLSYSCNETNEDDDRIKGGIMYYKEDGTLIKADEQFGQGYKQLTFTLPEDTDMVVVLFRASGSNNQVEYTNIQIEEGTEATEYEPYYVTSSTKVTQTKNHTLKAIWKAN